MSGNPLPHKSGYSYMYCTHYNQFFNADWLTYKLFTVSCLSATYTVLFISFDHHSYTLSSFIRLNYLIKYSQSRRNLHVHVYYKGMRGSRWRNQGRDSNPPPGKIIKNMPRTPLPPKKISLISPILWKES